ncbi:hypothetical protein D3C81_935730 [compost metagenome]
MAFQRAAHVDLCIVGRDRRGQQHLAAFHAARHRPRHLAPVAVGQVVHRLVLRQLGQVARRAGAVQVDRRGVERQLYVADAAGHHRFVQRDPHAQHHVYAFLQQVDGLAVDGQLELQVGVGLQEVIQGGHEDHVGQRRGGVDRKRAARRIVLPRQRLLGFFHVRQDAHAAFVVGRAVVGHADAARGPVQQLDAEVRLQVLDQAGQRGLGQVQRFGGARKAADVHDPCECLH